MAKAPKTPAVPPPIRTRQNIATLAVNDPIVEFYGRAIGELKTQPINNPLSWRYQAAIHQYRRTDDPLQDPGDSLPSTSHRGRFWSKCAHFNWFFLPWHRMYLHHFEQIIMSHVVRLGGPSDWALPYWNYSASAAAALLPEALRSPTLADGSTNHLFVSQRAPRANAGSGFIDPGDNDASAAFAETAFRGFGGHASGAGQLEGTPHGSMHMAVNGSGRNFMGNFTRAPLDPVFWLHHCNIDRAWKEWLRQGGGRANPTDTAWLTGTSFSFHDKDSSPVDMTSSQVLNTRAAPLLYKYDDEP